MKRTARELHVGDVITSPIMGTDSVRKIVYEFTDESHEHLRTVRVQWQEAFCWTKFHPDQPLEVFKG
jgi:hypothetical protein